MKLPQSFLALSLLATVASAQSMNLDFGDPQSTAGGAPASEGGAFGQTGHWNLVSKDTNYSVNLRDLQDQATSAYCWVTDLLPTDFHRDNTNTGSESALLDDCMSYSAPLTWGINGLENGTYEVVIYAFAPDNPTSFVSLVGGNPSPDYGAVSVGGSDFGTSYEDGVTHTRQVVLVESGYLGVILDITSGFGSLNGVQITKVADLHDHACYGDGADVPGCTPCPCGNDAPNGTVGGCLNSAGTAGSLRAWEVPSVSENRLRFSARSLTPNSFAILISGSSLTPVGPQHFCFGFTNGIQSTAFDGLRCVALGVQRHGVRATDSFGQVTPGWGGAFAGPPEGIATMGGFNAGETRYFQVVYRDLPESGCGTGQNTTEAVRIDFLP